MNVKPSHLARDRQRGILKITDRQFSNFTVYPLPCATAFPISFCLCCCCCCCIAVGCKYLECQLSWTEQHQWNTVFVSLRLTPRLLSSKRNVKCKIKGRSTMTLSLCFQDTLAAPIKTNLSAKHERKGSFCFSVHLWRNKFGSFYISHFSSPKNDYWANISELKQEQEDASLEIENTFHAPPPSPLKPTFPFIKDTYNPWWILFKIQYVAK